MTREPRPGQRMPYLMATRPPFLLAAAVGVCLGWASAHYDGVALQAWSALLTLLGAVLANAAVNVLNDYYDARNGGDAANHERVFPFTGGSRLIQNGVISVRAMGLYGRALFAATALLGLVLLGQGGAALLAVGALGLLVVWGYSAPPLWLNARGLGEPAVALCFGVLIPLGADLVQRGAWAWTPLAAGAGYGLLVANLLYINQFPDRRADAGCGKRTWVVRLGARRARWGYALTLVAAAAVVALNITAGVFPAHAAWALVPLILGAVAAADLLRHAETPARLVRAIRCSILAALLHGGVLAMILILRAG